MIPGQFIDIIFTDLPTPPKPERAQCGACQQIMMNVCDNCGQVIEVNVLIACEDGDLARRLHPHALLNNRYETRARHVHVACKPHIIDWTLPTENKR